MHGRCRPCIFYIHLMQPNLFHSERLVFREIDASYAPQVLQLNSDPLVLQYLHELPTRDEAHALSVINERILPQYRQYGYGRWAVHTRNEDQFIGWCGLKYRPERQETDLGYRLLREAWGQGYATEAAAATLRYGFEVLGLERIVAIAQTGNLASLRVLEKCGMQFLRMDHVDGFEVKVYEVV